MHDYVQVHVFTCGSSATLPSDVVSSLVIVDCIASSTVVGLAPGIGVVRTLPTGITETGHHWSTIGTHVYGKLINVRYKNNFHCCGTHAPLF